jgi:hypothetical protein
MLARGICLEKVRSQRKPITLQPAYLLAFASCVWRFAIFVFNVRSYRVMLVDEFRCEWRCATAVEHFVSACRGSESFVTR